MILARASIATSDACSNSLTNSDAPPSIPSDTILMSKQGISFRLAVKVIPAASISHISALNCLFIAILASASSTNLSPEAQITGFKSGTSLIARSFKCSFVGIYTVGYKSIYLPGSQ